MITALFALLVICEERKLKSLKIKAFLMIEIWRVLSSITIFVVINNSSKNSKAVQYCFQHV